MGANRRSRDGQRGQVLAIVAGGVFTLLLLLGLVIDGGIAVFNRRDGQNVSDIAALAGAHEVANFHTGEEPSPDTYDAIADSAAANGCSAGGAVPCSWQAWYVGAGASGPVDLTVAPMSAGDPVPSNALGVRVEVLRQPGTFLARLAHIDTWNVTTGATAIAWEPRYASSQGLIPIALKWDPAGYEEQQVYDLTEGKDGPGGFGYISWTGSNDPNALSDSICDPDNPSFYLPATFGADPGKSNADDVRACLDKWITTSDTVLIPIYDTVSGQGNSLTYNIIGVAAFRIVSQGQPAVDNIRAIFEGIYPFTDPVPGGTGSQPPKPNSTTFSLALVR